jgi:hypothetical protein
LLFHRKQSGHAYLVEAQRGPNPLNCFDYHQRMVWTYATDRCELYSTRPNTKVSPIPSSN